MFNGKELDKETGLYYYGARYYDTQISMWYGVDLLTEKYPSISGYCYVANNPIVSTDPDGKKIVIIYKDDKGKRQKYNYKWCSFFESFVFSTCHY